MTRPELASSFCSASAARKKLPGPDGVSDALLSLAPRAAARVAHPLIAKWAVAQVQPLALKGAFAAALYKNKGSKEHMASYRSVLLENTVAKHHYAFVRARVKEVLVMAALQCQCSTRAHMGCGHCSLVLESPCRGCKAAQK